MSPSLGVSEKEVTVGESVARSISRRKLRSAALALSVAAALGFGWATAPYALADTARSALYGGKADCGSPETHDFSHNGRVVFDRSGDLLTVSFTLRKAAQLVL
jgi:hypothetical protein